MRPVEKRVLHELLHRLGELDELVVPARLAGAEALLYAVGAHLPPLVVVAAEPDLGDVVPALVLGDLARRQMAVIVDNRHLRRVIVVKLARGGRIEKKILIHVFYFHDSADYTT